MYPPRLLNQSRVRQGFTLVEMLTVVGIIALLVALMTPTLLDVVRSTRLNAAGDGLLNRLSLTQQTAISRSSEVEMRFYKYVDQDSDRPEDDLYYAYQVVLTPNGAPAKAVSDVYYLESGVILSSHPELSPILGTAVQQTSDTNGRFVFTPAVSGVDPDDVEYSALRFYPDGSCRLLTSDDPGATAQETAAAFTIPALNESFLTVVESREAESSQPRNYYCVQIDAYTGKTRVYRP